MFDHDLLKFWLYFSWVDCDEWKWNY